MKPILSQTGVEANILQSRRNLREYVHVNVEVEMSLHSRNIVW